MTDKLKFPLPEIDSVLRKLFWNDFNDIRKSLQLRTLLNKECRCDLHDYIQWFYIYSLTDIMT